MIKNCVLCDGLKDEFQNIKEQYPELQSNELYLKPRALRLFQINFRLLPIILLFSLKNILTHLQNLMTLKDEK